VDGAALKTDQEALPKTPQHDLISGFGEVRFEVGVKLDLKQ
jgi:hypothetical protein